MALVDPNTTPGVQPLGLTGYTLVFSDEFNDSSVDTTRWMTPYVDAVNSATATNYDMTGGNLRIWPITDTVGHGSCAANTTCKNFTLSSESHFTQKYGFFEAKMRLCTGAGQFPSFWLFNENFADYQPEIDIMEAYGQTSSAGWGTVVGGQLHPNNCAATVWFDGGGGSTTQSGSKKISDTSIGLVDLTTAFHTYGCEWSATQLKFYFDGVLYFTLASPWSASQARACYVMFDLWWGSNGGNPCALTAANPPTLGNTNPMLIDYVRAWTIGGSSPTFSASTTTAPANGATIAGTVLFEISGNLIQNAELLPPTGYTPSYGTFVLTGGGTVGTLSFDTTALPNGTFSARIAAFDAPSGQTGNEITAMAARTWTINNAQVDVMPVCTMFDIG